MGGIEMLEQQYHEKPEICYYEPFKNLEDKWTGGGFSIRFQDEFAVVYQYIDLKEQQIKLFIPFDGDEKKCWNCGGNRELIIRLDIDGNLLEYSESCDKPIDIHGELNENN